MSYFVRKFGIDCILLLALAFVLLGIAKLAGAAPPVHGTTASQPVRNGPGKFAELQGTPDVPRRAKEPAPLLKNPLQTGG